jgi:hypothetical protein
MRVPLYIIRFAMLNRVTLHRAAGHDRGRRPRSLCNGLAHSSDPAAQAEWDSAFC